MKKTYLFLMAMAFSVCSAQYCQPTFEYGTDGNMITRVIFSTIDNTSPFQSGTTPQFEDYTAQITTVTAGQTYPLSIKGPSSTFESDVVVYIDFNHNNSFADAGESFYIGRLAAANPANALTLSSNISIPATATVGNTRMRIVKNTNTDSLSNASAPNSITGPCATLRAGQVEEYTLNIVPPTVFCSGADPDATPGATGCISFNYGGETVEYTTVRAADGNIWLQQNLGSSQTATASNDENAYGDLFQWGRWADGHQKRNSAVTGNAASPNNPEGLGDGMAEFIGSTPKWWGENQAVTDTWEAASPADVTSTNGCDPCRLIGEGWRLPTETEWTAIIAAENITNIATAYESSLKLTIAGNRSSSSISNVGVRGSYWSSTVSTSNLQYAKYLYYSNITMNPSAGAQREQGNAVRCLKVQGIVVPATVAISIQDNGQPQINTNGGTLQLTAAITPANASQAVTWSITSGNGLATINQSGLVTATANGTITVQALSTANNSITDTIDIIITNQVVAPVSIDISVLNNAPAAIATNGGTLQLNAAVLPVTASQEVTWSITEGTDLATITQDGLITALTNGTIIIQAASTTDAAITSTIEIIISRQVVAPQSLIVTVANNESPLIHTDNGTLQLNAAILPAEASQQVYWSITAGSELASVNANGVVTAIGNGTVTVQATSAADNTILNTISILIINQNPVSAAPYCDVTAEWDVEPITLVQFAGIDNATTATVNGSPAYESFINLNGNVQKENTYTLTVKGNTVGLYEHDIRVFIDWNQDTVFDMDTEYYTTIIENTDGTDGVTATLDITVPTTALAGTTRMRITKDLWTAYEPGEFDGCTDAYYGQTEDYSLTVTDAPLGLDDVQQSQFTLYPNPTSDVVTVQAVKEISTITVYNNTGQLVAQSNSNQVSLLKAASGIYILKVEFADGSTSAQKIIKK